MERRKKETPGDRRRALPLGEELVPKVRPRTAGAVRSHRTASEAGPGSTTYGASAMGTVTYNSGTFPDGRPLSNLHLGPVEARAGVAGPLTLFIARTPPQLGLALRFSFFWKCAL